MMPFATHISISVKALIACAGLSFTIPAQSQVIEQEPDAGEVARTPLRDLNIASEDIPQILLTAMADPYVSEGLASCNDLVGQIAAIDQVLGSDFDIANETNSGISEGRVAQSVIGSFIPFRGVLREVSGANEREKEANMAITAGMVRRAFLKGLGQERGCSYPARPSAQRGTMTAGQ